MPSPEKTIYRSALASAAIFVSLLASSCSQPDEYKPLSEREKRQFVAQMIQTMESRIAISITKRDQDELRFNASFSTGYSMALNSATNIDQSCKLAAQTAAWIARDAEKFAAKDSYSYKLLEGAPYREETRRGVARTILEFRDQLNDCFREAGLPPPKFSLSDQPLEGVN